MKSLGGDIFGTRLVGSALQTGISSRHRLVYYMASRESGRRRESNGWRFLSVGFLFGGDSFQLGISLLHSKSRPIPPDFYTCSVLLPQVFFPPNLAPGIFPRIFVLDFSVVVLSRLLISLVHRSWLWHAALCSLAW